MRILFANGRLAFPIFHGGDGIGVQYLLEQFTTQGHEAKWVGVYDSDQRPYTRDQTIEILKSSAVQFKDANHDEINYQISDLKLLSYRLVLQKEFEGKLEDEMVSFKPDIIITQLNLSHNVVALAKKNDIKVVHYVHDTHPLNELTLNHSELLNLVVFNSNFTANRFKNMISCPSIVLYPPIDLDRYLVTKQAEKRFITMINPIKDKGSEILPHLFEAFPNEKFLIISGWRNPEVDVNQYKNVTVLPSQKDMREIYAQTKVLIVPSQWEETFGRVVVEAELNHIPVVASNVGGLSESVGDGGLLINEICNSNIWIQTLSKLLDNPEIAMELGEKGYKHSMLFDGKNHFNALIEFIES